MGIKCIKNTSFKVLIKYLLIFLFVVVSCVLYSCERMGEHSEAIMINTSGQSEPSNDLPTERMTPASDICVYVCGNVKNPGVYTMKEGSRIYEAIELAGGVTKEAATERMNLAEVLKDGQKIRVISADEADEFNEFNEPEETGGYSELPESDDHSLININTASKEQLMRLPGIGDAKASAIIAFRESNGPFTSIEAIMNVSGIKQSSYNNIKDLIKV